MGPADLLPQCFQYGRVRQGGVRIKHVHSRSRAAQEGMSDRDDDRPTVGPLLGPPSELDQLISTP